MSFADLTSGEGMDGLVSSSQLEAQHDEDDARREEEQLEANEEDYDSENDPIIAGKNLEGMKHISNLGKAQLAAESLKRSAKTSVTNRKRKKASGGESDLKSGKKVRDNAGKPKIPQESNNPPSNWNTPVNYRTVLYRSYTNVR